LSDWWQVAYQRRTAEKALANAQLRITIYGSFSPNGEKDNLLRLAQHLREHGFDDTDIVEGLRRPNPWGYNSHEISKFYLECSDVNFLVFSRSGARLGVTTELDLVLDSPELAARRSCCVVFEQMEGTARSLGKLQQDRLLEVGEISVVPFETWKQLCEIAYLWAVDFCKKLSPMLRARLPP
jgi:GH35 family endo-1,4-beta-xylanase